MKTFKLYCGCEIHVIKWSQKVNSITMQSCSLHKTAPVMLAVLKRILANPLASIGGEMHGEAVAAVRMAEDDR